MFFCAIGGINHNQIVFKNAGINHAVAAHFQGKITAFGFNERSGHGYVAFHVLFG